MQIRRQREHKEQAAQNVFALFDPSYRFRAQRMNCENGGNECASPVPGASRTCVRLALNRSHLPQHQKQQDDGCGVKKNIREMERARIRSKKLKLEHVRNVFQREPVRRRPMSECPSDVMEGEAAVYFRNFVNVFGIVEVDERKLDRLSEHEPNQRDQTDADAG